MSKIFIKLIFFCFFYLLSIANISANENEHVLSNDPCGDLFNKITENVMTLQNAPYLGSQFYGFSMEPGFMFGHDIDGISMPDELEDHMIVTNIPDQNSNTFYLEDKAGLYTPYIKSLLNSTNKQYEINGLMEGDLIYKINGIKLNMEEFYDAWSSIFHYYGKNYSFIEYLYFDFINEDLGIDYNNVDNIELGIFRPSEFDDGHEFNIDKDLLYVSIDSSFEYPMIPGELELDVSKIIEINSKGNYFSANYVKKLINWDKYELTRFSSEIFGDNTYYCSWDDTDIEYGTLQTLWMPSMQWTNRLGFDKDQIKQTIQIAFYPEILENNCPCAVVTLQEEGLARFQTYFDYRSFPFDKQELEISLFNYGDGYTYGSNTLEWSFSDAKPKFVGSEFVSPEKKRKDISGWSVIDDSEYEINLIKLLDSSNFRSQIEKGIVDAESVNWDTRDIFTYEMIWTKQIQRQWIYFFFKIIAPLVLILLICWSVFWTPSRELESRLTVTITCFLALVAYTFVIDDDLPQLSYLTLMDYVILVTYFFASLPTVISIISYNLAKKDEFSNVSIDRYCRYFGPTLYILTLYIILTINVNEENTLPIAKSLVFF